MHGEPLVGLRGRRRLRPAHLIRIMPAEELLNRHFNLRQSAGGFLFTVVFANGAFLPPADLAGRLAAVDLIIAADGGSEHCRQLGVLPDLLIGDLDSISPETRVEFQDKGVQVIVHPAVKEQTDLELAFVHAQGAGTTEIILLAGLGNRWDHSLANLLLAAQPQFAQMQVSFLHGEQRLHILRGENRLDALPGERVSLLPLRGDASGISTKGLAYPLDNETLSFGSSRGVSNIVLAEGAQVSVGAGVLLCVISPPDLD